MVDNYATTYTHGPEYTSSEGVYSTLRVIKNEKQINGNIALTQIMIFNSEIFTRQAKWVSMGLSNLELSWEDWETYASLSQMKKIGYTYTNLSYNSSTILKATINTSTTIYGNPLAAWVQLRVQSQTPYSTVNEIFTDGPFNGNASTFVVYARGTGFVNGHVIGVNVFWLY